MRIWIRMLVGRRAAASAARISSVMPNGHSTHAADACQPASRAMKSFLGLIFACPAVFCRNDHVAVSLEVVRQRAAYDEFWRAAGDMPLAGTIPATDAATVANSIPGSQPGFRQRLGISRCRLDLPSRILC